MGRIDHIVTEIYCDGPGTAGNGCQAKFSAVAGHAFHVEDRVRAEGWQTDAGSWLCAECWKAKWRQQG